LAWSRKCIAPELGEAGREGNLWVKARLRVVELSFHASRRNPPTVSR
jgi:hypothetical protein